MPRGSLSTRLIVVAVVLIALLAAADALRHHPDRVSPSTQTVSIPEERLPPEQEIARIGTDFARGFAASDSGACDHMSQPLCERLHCRHVGGVRLPNCTVPTRAYRASFAEAVIEGVAIKKYRATARFSNGEKIVLHGDGGTWMIMRLGGTAGPGSVE
jgi:hypothetical protein